MALNDRSAMTSETLSDRYKQLIEEAEAWLAWANEPLAVDPVAGADQTGVGHSGLPEGDTRLGGPGGVEHSGVGRSGTDAVRDRIAHLPASDARGLVRAFAENVLAILKGA